MHLLDIWCICMLCSFTGTQRCQWYGRVLSSQLAGVFWFCMILISSDMVEQGASTQTNPTSSLSSLWFTPSGPARPICHCRKSYNINALEWVAFKVQNITPQPVKIMCVRLCVSRMTSTPQRPKRFTNAQRFSTKDFDQIWVLNKVGSSDHCSTTHTGAIKYIRIYRWYMRRDGAVCRVTSPAPSNLVGRSEDQKGRQLLVLSPPHHHILRFSWKRPRQWRWCRRWPWDADRGDPQIWWCWCWWSLLRSGGNNM